MPDETRYPPSDKLIAELNSRFTYHAPKDGQSERYEALRSKAKEFAFLIAELIPPNNREQAMAFTHLDHCVMCANAGIARNE